MKKVFVLLFALVAIGHASGQTKQGDSSLGLTVGYSLDSHVKHPVVGFDYRYNITDEVRVAPSISHYFKHNGLSAWMGEVNAHYVVKLDDQFGFYPLGGITFSSWSTACNDDLTRLGATIGLGGELYATALITVGLEVKYCIIQDVSHPLAGIRVGYNF